MLKGLRRKAEKLARAAAATLTFLAPRYPALVCAIVAGERLVWGLRWSVPPSQRRARAETFFPYALPRSPWKHPSHQPSPSLFSNWAFAVCQCTHARTPHPLYPTRTKSLAKCPSSLAVHVCFFFYSAAQQWVSVSDWTDSGFLIKIGRESANTTVTRW